MKAKAKIKGSPFVVEVEPFYLAVNNYNAAGVRPANYNRFIGFKDGDANVYDLEQLEFMPGQEQQDEPAAQSLKISDVIISARLYNLLRTAFMGWNPDMELRDIPIVELSNHTRAEYIRIRNLGRKSFDELCRLLDEHGLDFKGEDML